MAKTVQEDFLYKKTYEFSYAASMVASSAKNKEIAALMESKAFSLLDSVLIADYEKTKSLVNSIINLASLMVDIGILHPSNREILIRESESIDLAIKALPKRKETLPELNLDKVFSKSPLPINPYTKREAVSQAKNGESSRYGVGVKRQIADKQSKQSAQSEIKQSESEIADKKIADEIADKNVDESSSFKSEMRQSAIMQRLQQIESCRLNELQSVFPEISERTLRYDIESLISKGLVERLGSRRNSIYQLKNRHGIIQLPGPSAQNLNPAA